MSSHDGQILGKESQDFVQNAALRVRDPNSDALVRSYPCNILVSLSTLALPLCPIAVLMLLTFFYRFEKGAEKRERDGKAGAAR